MEINERPQGKDKKTPKNDNAAIVQSRISFLGEILHNAQKNYLNQYLMQKKAPLENGMYFGYLLEFSRLLVTILIFLGIILVRLNAVELFSTDNMTEILDEVNWIVGSYCAVCLLIITTCLTNTIIFCSQVPSKIAVSFGINFSLSILLIMLSVPMATYWCDDENIIKFAIARNMQNGNEIKYLEMLSTMFYCCGFHAPEDYIIENMTTYQNPITGEKSVVMNSGVFMNPGFHVLPIFCCNVVNDKSCKFALHNGPNAEVVAEAIAERNYDRIRGFQVLPSKEKYWNVGCVDKLTSKLGSQVFILLILIAIFMFLTAVVTGFVILLLLYHDSLGEIIANYKVFGVDRCTGVYLLQWLDRKNQEDSEIEDFSMIEFLKNTDIDEMLEEPKPRRKF
ncbi:unnamed protein product [Caenorhabditis bovis]|uniref:Tetraspanin n=1 Tax=Caenorhabditis bovis TaxID=2654633 RepID=A0A8S1EVS1_9PELO|nr:unnamed protein product [Caenorhabditis bovis]